MFFKRFEIGLVRSYNSVFSLPVELDKVIASHHFVLSDIVQLNWMKGMFFISFVSNLVPACCRSSSSNSRRRRRPEPVPIGRAVDVSSSMSVVVISMVVMPSPQSQPPSDVVQPVVVVLVSTVVDDTPLIVVVVVGFVVVQVHRVGCVVGIVVVV